MLWKAQHLVVSKLPPLPRDFVTAEAIDAPAWQLWTHRYELADDKNYNTIEGVTAKLGKAERVFLYCTAPLRRILCTAFTVFFLPPKNNTSSSNNKLCTAINDKKQHYKCTSVSSQNEVCATNAKVTTKGEKEGEITL